MNKEYAIVTDGSCDLPKELCQEKGITVVPFYVSFDGEKYEKEIVEMPIRQFYEDMVKNPKVFPKSSMPSVLDYMDAYDKNELVRESLAHADLVLPGEKAILTRHHVDVLETGGMAVDYHAELELLSRANENNRTIYLVLRSEKEAKMVYRFLSEYIDRDQIVGIYVADGEVAEESLINDINMKLPDIVLLSMESTEQEEWLENNRAKVNTKLCVVIGSVMPLLFRENVPVPKWLKKLHLGGVYRWFLVMPYSHSLRRRIFHRKMDDYNTKKKFRR